MAKHIKRKSWNHNQRHQNFLEEMGGVSMDDIKQNELKKLEVLFNEIHNEIAPEMEAMQKADNYAAAGYRSQLENIGYTMKPGALAKYMNRNLPVEQSKGQDCDCELEERDSRLVSVASHSGGDENAPLVMS